MKTSVFERFRVPSRFVLAVVATIVFFVGGLIIESQSVSAAPGINQQINFQGRLFNAAGATVADGVYNLQFKIYQDGTGDTAGNPGGTLEWTESHLVSASDGVTIKNGYLSVQLGSVTAFGSNVDWNQDTIWLSVNIGDTTSCTITTDFDTDCGGDGEMLPMKRLSSTPFSLNSAMLGGRTADEFIQSGTTLQTANIAIQSSNAANVTALIQGANSQTADILQITADSVATPLLAVGSSGEVSLQNATDSDSAFSVQNASGGSLLTVDTNNSAIQIGSNTADSTGIFFMLDQYDQTTDPTNSVNGAMYYNTDLGKFRCYENNAWTNCVGAGAGTFADRDLGNLTATDINAALNATDNDLTLQTTNTGDVVINAADAIVLGSDTINVGSATADTTIQKTAQTTLDTAGNSLTLQGATGNGTGTGGVVTIQGGTGGLTDGNGGNLVLSGGSGTGAGVDGLIVLTTPAFSTTANDANCYTGGALVASSCTIALSSVNGSAGIIVGVSTEDQTVTLPDPTLLTAGRIVYITAANGSSDFKLVVNGGGTGNEIAMRQNSSATMLWNGTDWTAAGASSSTTLQSAYDNTLQSAGGAELIVSKTSATNGLTIRDSSVNPVNGALLSVQTSSAAGLFSVNSNVKEYTSNSGAEAAGASASQFPASTWSALGAATVSRYTTAGDYIATGEASVSIATTAAANDGVANTLNEALVAGTTYNVSFTSRLASGNFTDLEVYYSVDGTTASVLCTENEAVTLSYWKKVNCAFTAPSSGITSSNALFIRQAGATARTFYVDNASVTIAADYNYATDGGVSDAGNFASNWVSVSGATVSRSTTVGYNASDSAEVITTGANQGIKNNMSISPLVDTTYRVTAYSSSTTAGFNSFTVRYSRDGGTNFVDCADYNTQSISGIVTNFTKVTCYITTDSTAPTDPDMYFIQTDATGRTFYIDNVSITLNSTTTPNVQIGGGSNGGPTTLFTLDRGASAPIASDNDALLGSMYYDTTLGKLQCYEADGWGACGSSPDNIVTISPEYTNAVLNGTGVGTMTSNLCSDALNINDGSSGQATVCGTNETYNFYKWTSPQATAQTYSIYVTYELPTTFKEFEPSSTTLMGRTDSTNATVSYQVYRNNPTTGLTACGSAVSVSTGSASAWQTGLATGLADPSVCGFNAGDSIVFKINTIASQNANAYVGNLGFTFSNR